MSFTMAAACSDALEVTTRSVVVFFVVLLLIALMTNPSNHQCGLETIVWDQKITRNYTFGLEVLGFNDFVIVASLFT